MRDEDWLLPEKIIGSGFQTFKDPETGLEFTEHDLAQFTILARMLNSRLRPNAQIDLNIFLNIPFVFESEADKLFVWTYIIHPHMRDPDRLLMQDIINKADERSKQRFMEAISYVPEVNRPK